MTTDAPPPTRRALRAEATGANPTVPDFEIAVDHTSQPILDATQAMDAEEPGSIPVADDRPEVDAPDVREDDPFAVFAEDAHDSDAGTESGDFAESGRFDGDAPVLAESPDPAPDAGGGEPVSATEPAPAPDAPDTETEPAPEIAQSEAEVVATGTIGEGTLVVEQNLAPSGPVALGWIDDRRLALTAAPVAPGGTASPVYVGPDLLAKAPRRSPWRPGVLIPVLLMAVLAGTYAATTLLWPLHAVAPQIEARAVQPVAAAAAAVPAPAAGSAAVSVAGIDGALASSADASTIASITKVVTALMVLDRMPLAVGESGPEYRFTSADRSSYWQYRARGESALDVPVGGTLTQYQLLEGMLIGSANNYADRLAGDLWPTDTVFANAANTWLNSHGVPGVTIADPTGIESGNVAAPESLLPLAERAMANPVIAEIVGRQSVTLPGAGNVENTNPLLADPGVVGIKTGSLDAFNLLAAKDVAIGATTVRVYGAVLGQPDPDARNAAMRALFAQAEQELQLQPSVPVGTVVGAVVTEWGEPIDIVTTTDASVVLWNGGSASAASDFALGDADASGDVVGELTVAGPLDRTTVELALADDVEGPDAWWRLTHPLDLFGLN